MTPHFQTYKASADFPIAAGETWIVRAGPAARAVERWTVTSVSKVDGGTRFTVMIMKEAG
jgi:hypothetical protein